jgi:hypothetical protein
MLATIIPTSQSQNMVQPIKLHMANLLSISPFIPRFAEERVN